MTPGAKPFLRSHPRSTQWSADELAYLKACALPPLQIRRIEIFSLASANPLPGATDASPGAVQALGRVDSEPSA